MASVNKVKTKNGEIRYRVRYRDPSGKDKEKWLRRKVDADRFARNTETDIDRGEWLDPRRGQTKTGTWMREWHGTRRHLRPSTEVRDRGLIEGHIIPALGEQAIASIQPNSVRGWVGDLTDKGLAPATVKKIVQLLGAAMEAAADDGLISQSPVRRVSVAPAERTEMRFLSHEEVGSLAVAIDPRYRTLVVTAAYTGLRFGELAALRLSNVNLLRRSLTVTETTVEVQGKVITGPPKTASSRRQVTIPRSVTEAIARHIATYGIGLDGQVFPAPQGGYLRRPLFRRRIWLPAVEASVGQPCRFHDLRHTHAAFLIAENVHPKVLQERLGHSSIKTSLDVYGHLFDGLDEEAADTLDASIAHSGVGLAWG